MAIALYSSLAAQTNYYGLATTNRSYTAYFTPPDASLVVAQVCFLYGQTEYGSSGNVTLFVGDSANGVTYALGSGSWDSKGENFAGVWTHYYAYSPGSIQLTLTSSLGRLYNSGNGGVLCTVAVLTGCNSGQNGAAASAQALYGLVQTAYDGSWVVCAATENAYMQMNATSGTAQDGSYETAGQTGATGHASSEPFPAGSQVTVGWSYNTAAYPNWAGLEVVAEPVTQHPQDGDQGAGSDASSFGRCSQRDGQTFGFYDGGESADQAAPSGQGSDASAGNDGGESVSASGTADSDAASGSESASAAPYTTARVYSSDASRRPGTSAPSDRDFLNSGEAAASSSALSSADASLALDGAPVEPDAGSFAESASVYTGSGSTAVSGSDAAAGNDGGEALSASLPSPDAGSFRDGAASATPVSGSDAAAGNDGGEHVAEGTSSADAFAGNDGGEALSASPSSADASAGNDGAGPLSASPSSADAAAGTDGGTTA